MTLPTGWSYATKDEEEERKLPQGWSYASQAPATGGATHPYVPDQPKPADLPQLRAGTGGFVSDIAQDAANILLPERFAAPIIEGQNPPGSSTRKDEFGNYILARPGGDEHYLNKPGLGTQDALNVAGALAAGGGAAKLGAAIPGVGPAVSGWAQSHPIVASGIGGGTYSLAQQVAGTSLTDEEMSSHEIARDTVAASVLPMALKPLVSPFRKTLAHLKSWTTSSGKLTKDARKALDAAGIKHEYLSTGEIKDLNRAIAKGSKYVDEVRGRKAVLEVDDIQTTKGMIGQRPRQIAKEIQNPLLNRWSEGAENIGRQGDAMAPRTDPADFGDELVRQSNAQQQAAGQSFDVARRAGEVAEVPPAVGERVLRGMQRRLGRDLSDSEVQSATAGFPQQPATDTIEILGPDGKVTKEVTIPGDESPNTIRELYEWRRQMPDPTGKGKAAFDAELKDVMDQKLAGEMGVEAIQAWRQANKQYTEFSQFWRSGDVLDKIVKRDKQGYALRMDPENTWNLLMNASKSGFISKPGIRQSIRKLQTVLGPDSPAFNSFRDALQRRMLQLDDLVQPTKYPGVSDVKGHNLEKHWSKVKSEWGEFLTELYPPKTIEKMDNFVTKAAWLDQSTGNAPRLAPSTSVIVNGLKRVGDATFRWARSGARQAEALARESGQQSAESALGGSLTRGLPSFPGATLAEADEVMWDEVYNQALIDSGYDIPGWVGRQ